MRAERKPVYVSAIASRLLALIANHKKRVRHLIESSPHYYETDRHPNCPVRLYEPAVFGGRMTPFGISIRSIQVCLRCDGITC